IGAPTELLNGPGPAVRPHEPVTYSHALNGLETAVVHEHLLSSTMAAGRKDYGRSVDAVVPRIQDGGYCLFLVVPQNKAHGVPSLRSLVADAILTGACRYCQLDQEQPVARTDATPPQQVLRGRWPGSHPPWTGQVSSHV